MPTRAFFFDATAGSPSYTSDSWAQILTTIMSDGYVPLWANQLQVVQSTPAAMTVDVNTGAAFIQGRFFEQYTSAQTGLVIGTANPTNPRIDRVVVRLDFTAKTITLAVKAGTAAPSPAAPTMQRDSSRWEISLAQILVAAGAISIVTANITDDRGNSSVCGPAVPRNTQRITATAPIALSGADSSGNQTLSIAAASGSAPGTMSAADKAKLDAASAAATPSVLVLRDGSGNTFVNSVNVALDENLGSQPLRLYGRTAADLYVRSFNPAAVAVGAATSATTAGTTSGNAATATALQGGGADRVKLDGIQAGAQVNRIRATLNSTAVGSGGFVDFTHGLGAVPVECQMFFEYPGVPGNWHPCYPEESAIYFNQPTSSAIYPPVTIQYITSTVVRVNNHTVGTVNVKGFASQ